jgi:DNA-binding response OmpR family regulator
MRLQTVLKRFGEVQGIKDDHLDFGDYVLDQGRHQALHKDGRTIPFTSSEFALIWTLVKAEGKILSRDILVDAVSTGEGPSSFRAIDTLVSRVRKKLGKGSIVTVPGRGYKCAKSTR